MKSILRIPRNVYAEQGAVKYIGEILGDNCKKVAIFSDKGIRAAGLLEEPAGEIKKSGIEYTIFDEIPAEPDYLKAQEIIDEYKKEKADFIIAIGGGSVMDIAKLASIAGKEDFSVKKLLVDPARARKQVRTLMIPTTAGTGSEATPNSIVAVPEEQVKVGIVNTEMIADYVILDCNMIKNLPLKIAAATGVDALAHAIECYTSNKANYFSDMFALEALSLIFRNIERACNDTSASDAKMAMMTAAFYGGAAITASGTTAVHALSYPLGGKYHIPHGVSNAMLLAPVMRFNQPACSDRLAAVYDRMSLGRISGKEEKAQWVIERIEEIVTGLGIPKTLRECGIDNVDIGELVESGMKVHRLLDNNKRKLTPEDAGKIYEEII